MLKDGGLENRWNKFSMLHFTCVFGTFEGSSLDECIQYLGSSQGQAPSTNTCACGHLLRILYYIILYYYIIYFFVVFIMAAYLFYYH